MKKNKGHKRLTIAFVSSEVAPYSKTGGLADVAGALPKAIARLGHNVHIFTPLHKMVDREKYKIPKRGIALKIPLSARICRGKIVSIEKQGSLNTHFIENDGYYHRDGIYQGADADYEDNAERFIFFCKATLEGIRKLKIKPDIIHVNDWQSSLIPIYLKSVYKDDPLLGSVPSMLTIHNLGYQGRFSKRNWHLTGLDWELFTSGKLEFHGDINFLKGGIEFADIITTVSKTYAKEIQAIEMGHGLGGVLLGRSKDIHGVLNGIDHDLWNPETDKLIPANYSARNLEGKKVCKTKLLEEMGLQASDKPLIAVVSRLADQKGFKLLLAKIGNILDLGTRFVLLGSGDKKMERAFMAVARKRGDDAAVRIGYDEKLAHRIEAGSDIFLMPSLYEPCGLNQMYSLAYGTAPVVRATGGLNDTIINFNPDSGKGNGFKFTKFSSEALYKKTMEAVALFKTDRLKWYKMVVNGMDEDHSWAGSALVYEKLYRNAVLK
ncbi:Glycogen synthase, ADP-glucose transglucosylase [hydrothermal vent metagenome]|uniref:starch synthase n=1 Tax=hydrothermal vent metagenome TaxID=652676 RepID=A0A3B1CJK2_9ZZZZ